MPKKLGLVSVAMVCLIAGWFVVNALNKSQVVKIGVIASTDNGLGAETSLVAKYFAQHVKTAGAHEIEWIIRSPKMETDAFASDVELMHDEGVSVIVGGAISRTGIMLVNEAAKYQIPVISPNASSESLSAKDDGLVRLVMSTRKVGRLQAEYLSKQGYERVAIMVSPLNRGYSVSLAEEFSAFHDKGHQIFNLHADSGLPEGFAEYNPDCVLVIASSNELLQFLSMLKEQKLSLKVVSVDWAFLALWAYSSELLENVEFLTQMGVLTDAYTARIDAYQNTTGQTASFGSHQAFSALDMALKALAETDGSALAVRKYFQQERVYDYSYGKIALDNFGDAIGQHFYVWTSKGGKVVIKERMKVPEFPE